MEVPIFGRRVARMRQQRGLTIQELAVQAQTTYQTIWRIENGKHVEPGIYIATRIARVLGVSLDYLCGVYEEEKETKDEELLAAVAV